MKKILKDIDKKFLISLLIIITLLSTFTAYQIHATITAEMSSHGKDKNKTPETGKYYTVADLRSQYDILCCYRGGDDGTLIGETLSTLKAGGHSTRVTDSGKKIANLKKGDEGETALTIVEEKEGTPFTKSSYSAASYGFYNIVASEIAKPKEAYILAEMIEEEAGEHMFYDDEESIIQYAWWTTEAGNQGMEAPLENSLSLEATAFEAYIKQISDTNTESFVEQHYNFNIDGVVHEGDVPAPQIEYKPVYNEDANLDGDINQYDEVTVTWNGKAGKQTYTIGPFSINYIEESYAAADRPEVIFAGITDAKLYTNLGEVPKDKWKFNFINDERDTADNFEFPHANEVFYIELDYIEDATKITNLHFDFKYMNAGGKYDSLDGKYFEQTWTPDSKVEEVCLGKCEHTEHDEESDCNGSCIHGNTEKHPIKWKYWLELTGMEEKTSQLLAYGIIGARWYDYATLDINVDIQEENEGKFKIIKQIVDQDGNVINDIDQTKKFRFEVYENGELYDTVSVTPSQPYTSGKFIWKEGENLPVITVKELPDEDGKYEQYGEIETSGSLENGLITFVAKNKATEKEGSISITKRQIGTGLEDKEFSFKLYINNQVYRDENTEEDGTIKIKVNETWVADSIKWNGEAPKYRVEEINLPAGAKLVNLENDEGLLIENKTVNVTAVNTIDTPDIPEPEYENGRLIVKKLLDGNISSDQTFNFVIEIDGKVYEKQLKAGQTWSETFTWPKGKPAPQYKVTEVNIPEGFGLVEIRNGQGQLSSGTKVTEVICINEIKEEKKGNISIHKEARSNDKEGIDGRDEEFTFTTIISGTFEMSGESIVNGSKTITSTLKSGETVVLDEVTWKGDAPTYTVNETMVPNGWKMESITNDSGSLKADETIEVNCVNVYKIVVEYDLTMEMSGMVWEDKPLNEQDKNTDASRPNGKYDEKTEYGIEKIEVVIWKRLYDQSGNEIVDLRKHAKGYSDEGETIINFPIYTDINGVWKAPKMVVPTVTEEEKASGAVTADYDVEFTYDGQTYKPTDFLVSGNVEHFKKASNANKSQYLKDSMIVENEAERAEFDNKFEVITGDLPIDENGKTIGYATNSNGEVTVDELVYYSTDSIPTVDNNTRKISELQTTTEGYVNKEYQMKARTSEGGLTYPFDDQVHLENIKKTIDKIEGGLVVRYEYSATYPYTLNINLGLVKRDRAELAVTKDVYSAAVVVNQKLLNYQYNEYVDFESEKYSDYLNLQLQVADADISYKLDLYESDYYYRAKMYESNTEVNGVLQEFYKSLGKTDLADELDLDVFLTYKISIYNDSDSYLTQIRNLVDYYDEDLELVTVEQTKYIQEANGVSTEATTVVAKPAYVIKKGTTETTMWGEVLNKNIAGNVALENGTIYSNETAKVYNKVNINLSDSDLKISAGEKLELYLTFKVKTDEAPEEFKGQGIKEAVESYVRLGTKANIAEIVSYSTYYSDGRIAGRVDADSAPNNADIENKNDKKWYEDDTDSAPIITLDLYTETRNINGMAWEDEETENIDYSQKIGNGIYDEGERLIGNLTTQIVEKVRVKQADETYKEYDFVWPTDVKYDFLNNKSLEEITGFDSITLTSNAAENTGAYSFKNIPAGNYVVRFIYGYFASDSIDENGNLVKLDGISEPKTSDDDSRIPAVYNGQDFKTTTYQVNNADDSGKASYSNNENGYIDNEWHDFTTCKYDENGNVEIHNSDAIDNEARRLEVIAYSKVLDHEKTTVLATANDYNEDHTELYKNTSMFADTAKINLNIENMSSLAGQRIKVVNEITGKSEEVYAGKELTKNGLISNFVYGKSHVNGEKGTINIVNYEYNIDAIDIGLEERSNTELVLDKQIETIELKTNTGSTILKAVYDIDYEYTIDEETGKSSYKAKVELNEENSFGTHNLIAQNKDEENGLQNFRYIYYDDTIAQGMKLEVKYKFTALNVGEVDRTGKVFEMENAEEILAKANELKEQIYIRKGNQLVSKNHQNIGEYVGSIYYIGKRDAYEQKDNIVNIKVRQLIDYVDNDAVFKNEENSDLNSSWRITTATELLNNKVIDSNIISEYDGVMNIIDDKNVVYTTNERNNLILSVDSAEGDKLANPSFVVGIVPFAASKENAEIEDEEELASCMASMNLVMTRTIDNQISDEDLSYDNIAEIVRFENAVGKRDMETIAGNANPKLGEFTASMEERDASATELITFTPPTGLGVQNSLKIEILIVTLAALVIILIGVVIIKKTVLKK